MKYVLDLLTFFLTLGFVEAVVKPIARKWTQRKILAIAPVLLQKLDAILPDLVQSGDGCDLEAKVRAIAEELTGEDWGDADLDPLFQMFDIRKTADFLQQKEKG